MERSIAINPRNPAALYNRAKRAARYGRAEDAIAAFDAALAISRTISRLGTTAAWFCTH